jgi:hypothetical protein
MFENDKEVVGSGIDGSLHHIVLLELDAWRLLRFVNNLALRSSLVAPFSEAMGSRMHLEPKEGLGVPEKFMQVDGDVLTRLMHHGQAELRRLLDAPPMREIIAEDDELRDMELDMDMDMDVDMECD